MKIKYFVLSLVLLVALGGIIIASDATTLASAAQVPTANVARIAQAQGPIIIDHTCTDLSKIPDYWIEQAKELAVHYAHTSHGSQVRTYLPNLETLNPLYDFSTFSAGSSPPLSLSACDADALCMYVGNPPETYITPEDYWESSDGIARTRAVADTGLFDFSMWSWCGQASYYSDAQIEQYLDRMALFETEYPNMHFILMTGHTDGGSTSLESHNNMIRQYAIDNNMVLFDFADIETYDPLGGGPYDNNGEGTCTWCVDFCNDHPGYCTDLPSSCAHSYSHPEDALFCKLKAQAFWWMMARLAGWSGPAPDLTPSYKTAAPDIVDQGDRVNYTVVVRSAAGPLTSTVLFTDTLPQGLVYAPGSLSATSGSVDDGDAPTLRWSGTLTPTPAVTLTYAADVSAVLSGTGTAAPFTVITNTAFIGVPGYPPIKRTASVRVNWRVLYLPVVLSGPAQ